VLLDRSSHSNSQKQQQPHQIMATSILGKRQRSSIEAEGDFHLTYLCYCPWLIQCSVAEPFSVRTRKRRTRVSTPQIHIEEGVDPIPQGPQDVLPMNLDTPLQGTKISSSKSRIVTSKRIVRNSDTTPHQTVSAYTSSSADLNGTPFSLCISRYT
jgi:hypothetical protein